MRTLKVIAVTLALCMPTFSFADSKDWHSGDDESKVESRDTTASETELTPDEIESILDKVVPPGKTKALTPGGDQTSAASHKNPTHELFKYYKVPSIGLSPAMIDYLITLSKTKTPIYGEYVQKFPEAVTPDAEQASGARSRVTRLRDYFEAHSGAVARLKLKDKSK